MNELKQMDEMEAVGCVLALNLSKGNKTLGVFLISLLTIAFNVAKARNL
ncbi:MAG: hypothetical protein AAF572_01035 [Cyanobacteria bacterium P01_B01_bin.77]